MPWKVIHITNSIDSSKKRKKPSKKRRMIIKDRLKRYLGKQGSSSNFKGGNLHNWRWYNFKQTSSFGKDKKKRNNNKKNHEVR